MMYKIITFLLVMALLSSLLHNKEHFYSNCGDSIDYTKFSIDPVKIATDPEAKKFKPIAFNIIPHILKI